MSSQPVKPTAENMWQEDPQNPYSFEKVKPYLDAYDFQTILQAFVLEQDISEDIKFFYDDVEEISGYLFPGKEAVSFMIEGQEALELNDRDNLEFITYPVYFNAEEEAVRWGTANETLWSMRWEENYDRLDTIALGGVTDFYERFGWWPFAVSETLSNVEIPLNYYAELKIRGKRAYMFGDFNYDDTEAGSEEERSIPWDDGRRELIIMEDTLALPPHFIKGQLDVDKQKFYLSTETYGDLAAKRFIPHDPLFRFIAGVNDGVTPEAPFNNFLYQVPVPWHGFRDAGNNLYTVDEGDYGSTLVFWDKNDNFKFDYQQT